jgi:cbb3-type cytochrome oxidase subunit 3
MVTIEEYTSFFLSIILGLGISFELPILIFFLALFGIVSPKFLWKNIRYAILAVFLVAAIICPSPDPWTMCIYAVPMLALYLIGIGVAWWVHPSRRKKKKKEAAMMSFSLGSAVPDATGCPILAASLFLRPWAGLAFVLLGTILNPPRALITRFARASRAAALQRRKAPTSTRASLSPSARAGPPAPATSRPKNFSATTSARPA